MNEMSPGKFPQEPAQRSVTSREAASLSDLLVKGSRRIKSNRVSWIILVSLLIFAPLAFGAVEYWSIAVVEFAALALAISWIAGGAHKGSIQLKFNPMVFAAVGLQVWVAAQIYLGKVTDSANAGADLMLLFSYFLIFITVSNEYWSPRWIRRLALSIASFGFAVALFGIIQFFSWNGRLFWIRPIAAGTPFGPYVNRDHFAGLMEMIVPVTLSLVFSQRYRNAWKALFTFFAVVMVLATLISLSRGGMLSLAISTAAFAYLLSRGEGRKPVLVLVASVAICAVGWLVWLGASPLLERIVALKRFTQEASFGTRLLIAKDTLQIIREHPYTGTGLGTFSLVYPLYRSWFSDLVVLQAHNDYLQLLSEVGLIGFSFAVIWVVGLFSSVWRMVRDRTQAFSPLRLGAFCGCLGILIHSLFDFNLQIPANAVYFAALAALATREDLGHRVKSPTAANEG